jgi:NADH-quinone oxidoreductase subunit M
MLFTMASVGLPGTSNFIGEFLALAGIYQISTLYALLATTGIILGAAYMLYLYRRVVFGDLTKDDVRAMPDLNSREILTLAPIAAVVLWMGVYPESFLKPMRPDVARLVERIERAKPAGDSQPTPGNPAAAKAAHGDEHGAPAAHGEPAAKTEAH